MATYGDMIYSGFNSQDKKIEKLESTANDLEEKLNHTSTRLEEKVDYTSTMLSNRLEEIQNLHQKIDENRTRRHALEIHIVKNHQRTIEKMYYHSMIFNILFCVIIAVFMVITCWFSNQYDEIYNKYTDLTYEYTETVENYKSLEKEINSLEANYIVTSNIYMKHANYVNSYFV